MIKVQPPDLPNSSVASTLTPGNGYAPSIPLTYMIKEGRSNLRDLLVRAKAGINAEDVQKEAHLSYFLGTVYESRREFDLSTKFYKRFLGFAKTMEDKIGMALGSNRVALSEYYRGNINKCVTYNQENLKLSDKDNSFAGFYNLGICFRKLDRF
jgi:tetratricopeptide (TPR) repeat protein